MTQPVDCVSRVADGAARCLARFEHQLVERPILVAVSGGLDSTVLCALLARLAAEGRLPGPVHLAHVDHGTRVDSSANAEFVCDLAEQLDLPITVRRLQLQLRGTPSEEALRDARYEALQHIADEIDAGAILTAHHADDNIETVLFRMMRGTSYRGLAGIRDARRIHGKRLLVRPLLAFRRSTLAHVRDELGLSHWEDSSNRDLRYARNRLRHATIPALRASMGVSLDAALMVVARTARAASDIVEAQGTRILSQQGRWVSPWRLDLDVPEADADQPAQAQAQAEDPFLRDALRQAFSLLSGDRHSPLGHWLDRAMALLTKPAGSRLGGRPGRAPMPVVERTRRGLVLIDPARVPEIPGEPVDLEVDGGRTRFGVSEWLLDAWAHPEPPLLPSPRECGRYRALIDPRQAPGPWHLRPLRPGDRFQPLGHPVEVDARRYLARRGLPRFDRNRVPLVVDARGMILWIPGVEIAHPARLQLNTRRCVEIRARRG